MGFWEKHNPFSYALATYGIAAAGDWLSSSLCNHIPGLEEVNVLTRDAALHFVLWKGIALDMVFFALLSGLAILVYLSLGRFSKLLATYLSSSLFMYLGINRLLTAVIPNFILFFRGLNL